jgi:hypothetical protein
MYVCVYELLAELPEQLSEPLHLSEALPLASTSPEPSSGSARGVHAPKSRTAAHSFNSAQMDDAHSAWAAGRRGAAMAIMTIQVTVCGAMVLPTRAQCFFVGKKLSADPFEARFAGAGVARA